MTWAGPAETGHYSLLFQVTPRVHVERELGQRPDADAGRPLRLIRLRLLGPRGAGDVHVHPREIARELLDEERRADRAARAAAGVGEVGNLALEQILIVVVQPHRPRAVAGSLARQPHLLDPRRGPP